MEDIMIPNDHAGIGLDGGNYVDPDSLARQQHFFVESPSRQVATSEAETQTEDTAAPAAEIAVQTEPLPTKIGIT